MSVAQYYEQYCQHQFAKNHYCWLDGFDSEIERVRRAKIIPRLYIVLFSDHTESVVDHNAVVYLQVLNGTVANW